MKLTDFDFRIWLKKEQCYLNEAYLENSSFFKAMGLMKGLKDSSFGNDFDEVHFFTIGKNDLDSGGCDDNGELELWSGLHDLNGKKIYENDIVEICSNKYQFMKVGRVNRHFQVVTDLMIESLLEICDEDDDHSMFDNVEVIGNIHENPELLENQEKKEQTMSSSKNKSYAGGENENA